MQGMSCGEVVKIETDVLDVHADGHVLDAHASRSLEVIELSKVCAFDSLVGTRFSKVALSKYLCFLEDLPVSSIDIALMGTTGCGLCRVACTCCGPFPLPIHRRPAGSHKLPTAAPRG
jgi:hypothetical protein